MHTALRADGVLLDVRPAPEHPWVEIQRGTAAVRLGQFDDSYRHGTLAIADAAIAHFVAMGHLARECTVDFTFIYHCDSVETWLVYMAEHWHTARIPADLIARARATFVPGTSDLRIPRTIRATRYRRACGE